jgi:regulator of replication initiation timing
MSMKKIIIGTQGEFIDLDILLATRLLVQANSGGGKSYLLRRLVEQLFGKVPIIIIDPEGEFATLREKFDFVLVGKGGETPADPRSASLLAHKLLELNASAVCDIYEMKTHERHRWVRLFLEAMINAPKELWHPVVVIVDEAHIFAPEKGQGESEAFGAMADLATRGRKRGFCAIFATQRLAKLSKNVSAEMQNVLLGQTFQDIDRKRASDTLGILKSNERQFFNEIKLLEPGNFYALGRAISKELISLKVDKVQTSTPESGKFKVAPPPTPAKIKALLPNLSDLPKEAEEMALNEAQLRKENSQLKRQLTEAQKSKADPEEIQKLKRTIQEREGTIRSLIKVRDEFFGGVKKAITVLTGLPKVFEMESDREAKLKQVFAPRTNILDHLPDTTIYTKEFVEKENKTFNKFREESGNSNLPIGERTILSALIQFDKPLERKQLTVMTAYKRSSRDAYIARLTQKGFVQSVGSGSVEATESGKSAIPNVEPLPTGEDLQEFWFKELPSGESAILKVLIEHHPNAVERDKLDEATGFKRSSRDAYLARLAAKELVVNAGPGLVKASENLF